MKLVIGNKNYSSWSLRPWLVLEHFGLPFEEVQIPLYTPDSPARLREWSPSAKAPVLIDGDITVWDSLAICEYVADTHPELDAWPTERVARARARSVSAEMHSSFGALRSTMPMNCRARGRHVARSAALDADVARVQEIWTSCRAVAGGDGPWLFDHFSIADAMFAPVAFRFQTYGVACDGLAGEYLHALLDHPAMKRWAAAGERESEVIADSEVGR